MTNVIAINGSPRSNGNTSILLRHVMEELEKAGIATEEVNLGGRVARGMHCLHAMPGDAGRTLRL